MICSIREKRVCVTRVTYQLSCVCNYTPLDVVIHVTRTVIHFHPRTQNHIFVSVSEVLRSTVPADLSINVHTKFRVIWSFVSTETVTACTHSTLHFSAKYILKIIILLCVTLCSLVGGNQKKLRGCWRLRQQFLRHVGNYVHPTSCDIPKTL
jgi:hypothetical protein